MRRLTVLSVSYPLAPVGPDAVGGSEQVLSALDHALVAQGHRSVVVACEGSQVAGRLRFEYAPDWLAQQSEIAAKMAIDQHALIDPGMVNEP